MLYERREMTVKIKKNPTLLYPLI